MKDNLDILNKNNKRVVELEKNVFINALGQGTWHMGERVNDENNEIKALQMGIDLGMKLIDTAEMYAEGEAEKIVAKAIKGRRNEVFLVSKFYPENASREKAILSCEKSLKRLEVDYLDMYLLHWRGRVPLVETVKVLEELKKDGKIKRWGVSNFDIDDMRELWNIENGNKCAVNQVLYHLGSRGIEYDLLPWCCDKKVPIMAYCPTAQAGKLKRDLLKNIILNKIASDREISPIQVLLAWLLRYNNIIAIPKAVKEKHVLENAQVGGIFLSEEEIKTLDREFPAPNKKTYLDIV